MKFAKTLVILTKIVKKGVKLEKKIVQRDQIIVEVTNKKRACIKQAL
jgi:hypothetical protein